MKARTKAQRRGRTRKHGAREPNGQLQRPSLAEIRHATIEARMRQHGLTLVQAGERLAGYEIGRLYLRGQIDLVDVEVCDDYVNATARYMALVCPTHPFPKAMDYVHVGGAGADPDADRIASIRDKYDKPHEYLKEHVVEHLIAFHDVAFFDNPARDRLHSIKAVLDALRKLNRRPTREGQAQ